MFIFFAFVYNPIIKLGVMLVISKILEDNLMAIKELFHNASDIVEYKFLTLIETEAAVVYIDGLCNKNGINDNVIKPLMENLVDPSDIRNTIQTSESEDIKSMDQVVKVLTEGLVVLFHEGFDHAISIDVIEFKTRAIEQSLSEQVIRGPKEAFVEDITINKTLIRRKIKNRNLVFEDYIFGKQTNTNVSIVYIDNIVNPEVLKELKDRLNELDLEVVLDVHYIDENISDSPHSLIETSYNTEKPDVLAAKILEGRIGIICDGSPNVITIPKFFIECLMSSEDYYLRPIYASFLRLLRFMAFFISIMLPGVYLALSTFHREMIPTDLLITMANERAGVPLSAFFEALVMILFFEFLKESGLRLPQPIGQTVTIVGGLVIGQASVEAGVTSAIMIIVVGASGITEFVNPSLREFIVLYRLVLLVLGGAFGLFGITCGFCIMAYHLVSMKSFGVPYLYPIAPFELEGMKDFITRTRLNKNKYRPKYISNPENMRKDLDEN